MLRREEGVGHARSPRPARGGVVVRSSVIPLLVLLQGRGGLPSRIGGLPGDSISLRKPPLPGGIADLVRRIFDVPQAVQIGGAVLVVLVLVGLMAIAWWQRAELLYWFQTRSRRLVVATGAVALVLIGVIGWFSVQSWNYMQHDNDFCSGCHVMAPAWQKFQTTKHAKLSCHQCHQQSLFASTRQLVLWVADRPGQISAHSKVPNERCITCHVKGDPARWKQIAATEGHRLHLESAKLPGLQCVRCHGFSVHQFIPSDMTCGQAGCHTDIRIRLGRMTMVTSLHCALCHKFTRQAAAPMSVTDSVRRWLTPTRTECFSCHAMQKLLADQQLAHDPHGAVCGACHNPHTQTTAAQAVRSCARAGCHSQPEAITPLHRGLPSAALANCTMCHKPHSWKTRGGECTACHGTVPGEPMPGRVSSAPAAMPWDRLYRRLTAAMLSADPVASFARGRALSAAPARVYLASARPGARWRSRPSGSSPLFRLASAKHARRRQQPQDSQQPGFRGFSHGVHRQVACTSCHSARTAHGALLVRTLEDCMRCHHAPEPARSCTRCHRQAELPQGLSRTVTVRTSVAPAPAERKLPFNHADHPDVACGTCHSGPPTLLTIASCTSCHVRHHTGARQCRVCHVADAYAAHDARAHLSCSGGGCHQDAAISALSWSRQLCLACHQRMSGHEPGRNCAECHRVPELRSTPLATPARSGR